VRGRLLALLVLALAAGVAASCFVILDERQQAFRTLLGDPEPRWLPLSPVLRGPGVFLRIPGLHELYRFSDRLQRFDAEPVGLFLSDGREIEVDYFVVWRVADPRLVVQNTQQRDVLRLIDDTAFNEIRTVLAQHTIADLLSDARDGMTREIAHNCDTKLEPQGIAVADFQIRRTDYPAANLDRIFERMQKERERFAKGSRAEGEEEARKVRAEADRDSTVERATAQRRAQELRGEGDAEAARIYAEAYGQAPEFYAYLRSLEAYTKALDDKTTLVLSDNNPFLKYLLAPPPPPATP
jgi:membrane protease subunit HflC